MVDMSNATVITFLRLSIEAMQRVCGALRTSDETDIAVGEEWWVSARQQMLGPDHFEFRISAPRLR